MNEKVNSSKMSNALHPKTKDFKCFIYFGVRININHGCFYVKSNFRNKYYVFYQQIYCIECSPNLNAVDDNKFEIKEELGRVAASTSVSRRLLMHRIGLQF